MFFEDDEVAGGVAGVALGLAWTPFGGETVVVETQVIEGQGRMSFTGQIGDVMKESGQAAMTYVRSRAGLMRLALTGSLA